MQQEAQLVQDDSKQVDSFLPQINQRALQRRPSRMLSNISELSHDVGGEAAMDTITVPDRFKPNSGGGTPRNMSGTKEGAYETFGPQVNLFKELAD